MDERKARLIRLIRDKGLTWRDVSLFAVEMWPKENYQADCPFQGKDLCDEAAKVLGEDPEQNPWN